MLLSEADLTNFSYSIYDFVERATRADPEDMTPEEYKEEYKEAMIRRSLLSNISRNSDGSRFRFIAFCDGLTDLGPGGGRPAGDAHRAARHGQRGSGL